MKQPRSIAALLITACLLVMLVTVAYLLSSGPAVYLSEAGTISSNTVRSVYAPLGWLEDHSQACRDFLEWWADLWSGRRPN